MLDSDVAKSAYSQGVSDCLFDLHAYLHDYRVGNLSTGKTTDIVDPNNAQYFAKLGLARRSLREGEMKDHIKIELDFTPVEERLPSEMSIVLLRFRNGVVIAGHYYHGVWNTYYGWRGYNHEHPTHWAEIPG